MFRVLLFWMIWTLYSIPAKMAANPRHGWPLFKRLQNFLNSIPPKDDNIDFKYWPGWAYHNHTALLLRCLGEIFSNVASPKPRRNYWILISSSLTRKTFFMLSKPLCEARRQDPWGVRHPKSGPFWTSPLNPPTKILFLAHFVAKHGLLADLVGASHPRNRLATGLQLYALKTFMLSKRSNAF